MPETLMKWVLKLRTLIYVVLLLTVAGIEITHCVHANDSKIDSQEAFWPPDMIPHPAPPENPPREDEMS